MRHRRDSGTWPVSILDIGTQGVRALVAIVHQDHVTICGVGQARFLDAGQDGDAAGQPREIENRASLRDALNRALTTAEDMTVETLGQKVVPDEVVIGVSGQWAAASMGRVTTRRARPTSRVSEREVAQAVERAERVALAQAQEAMMHFLGQSNGDVTLLTAAIVDMRIDGARILDPLRVTGQQFMMAIFNVCMPLAYMQTIAGCVSDLGLTISHATLAVYAAAHIMGEGDILVIDLGDAVTDVAVIREGVLVGVGSFPIGGRIITRRIARAFHVLPHLAEEMKIAYSRKQITPEQGQQISSIITADIQTWRDGLDVIVRELADDDGLPGIIALMGGGSELPTIATSLQHGAWVHSLPFAHVPAVRVIRPAALPRLSDRTGLLTDAGFTGPCAVALWAAQARLPSHHGFADHILAKVVRASFY